jgi:hypothetical protein
MVSSTLHCLVTMRLNLVRKFPMRQEQLNIARISGTCRIRYGNLADAKALATGPVDSRQPCTDFLVAEGKTNPRVGVEPVAADIRSVGLAVGSPDDPPRPPFSRQEQSSHEPGTVQRLTGMGAAGQE